MVSGKEQRLPLAEQILAVHAGKERVGPGEFITARVDLILANDITAPIAIREFQKIGVSRVFDPQKIAYFCSEHIHLDFRFILTG